MDALRQDLRYAWRALLRAPGFTATVILTVAIGIAGTTTVFSIANAVLFRTLPVPEAERVVGLSEIRENGSPAISFTYPDYAALAESSDVVIDLAAQGMAPFGISTGDMPESVLGAYVSGSYFRMLGIQPTLGRFILPEEDAPSAEAVVVLSHAAWSTRFGSDPSVIGRTIELNARPVTVVGVAPAEFGGIFIGLAADLWVPFSTRALLSPGLLASYIPVRRAVDVDPTIALRAE